MSRQKSDGNHNPLETNTPQALTNQVFSPFHPIPTQSAALK
jgi:hypothetical protein